MTTRRNFLKVMLAAAAAPAIVKASSLMPIFVPKKEVLLPDWAHQLEDYTIESWLKPRFGDWTHVSVSRGGMYNEFKFYLDGSPVSYSKLADKKLDILQNSNGMLNAKLDGIKINLVNPGFDGHIHSLKIVNDKVQIIEPQRLIIG